jgi:hypothetical protein
LGIVCRRMGLRSGCGGLGASIIPKFPVVDPAVGLVGKYGPAPGKGQWGAGAQGGLRRGAKTSPERGNAAVQPVPHKKPGSCPFGSGRPSQERRAGGPRERWECSDGTQPSLATVRAAVGIGPEHPREEGLDGFGFGRHRSRCIEGGPAGGQVFGTMAIGEEAIVSDPH